MDENPEAREAEESMPEPDPGGNDWGAGHDPAQVEVAPDYNPNENGATLGTPSSIFDGLRRSYQETQEDRRKTIQIVPGRFGGNLAVRYKPGPWTNYRKRAERAMNKGGGEEAELRFAADTMVECIETIMFRANDGEELKPLDEANPEWTGSPVLWDNRLAEAVGVSPIPGSNAAICRAVFLNAAALNAHFTTLDAWLKESIPSDGEDDEDAAPPT